MMKTALFVAFCLCATAALAQVGGGSMGYASLSSTTQMMSHDQHASGHDMAPEQNLWSGTGGVYTAQGELPLWEVAPKHPPETPLGDVARAYRKEHETAKKAQFVYQN